MENCATGTGGILGIISRWRLDSVLEFGWAERHRGAFQMYLVWPPGPFTLAAWDVLAGGLAGGSRCRLTAADFPLAGEVGGPGEAWVEQAVLPHTVSTHAFMSFSCKKSE